MREISIVRVEVKSLRLEIWEVVFVERTSIVRDEEYRNA